MAELKEYGRVSWNALSLLEENKFHHFSLVSVDEADKFLEDIEERLYLATWDASCKVLWDALNAREKKLREQKKLEEEKNFQQKFEEKLAEKKLTRGGGAGEWIVFGLIKD